MAKIELKHRPVLSQNIVLLRKSLGLFAAHNFNVEPLAYKIRRDIAGVRTVCSPWTIPADDDGSCMERQRALDLAGGITP